MNLKLYKLFTLDGKKTYYTLSKLKSNLCINLFVSYYNNRRELNHTYYDIIKEPHNIELIEEFEDRTIAKDIMNKLIKDDVNCVNKIQEEKEEKQKPIREKVKTNKAKKAKVRKTDDPEYNKKYYASNKDRLRGYYSKNKDKLREYNKKRYVDIKEKLERLKKLEDENKN
jgi:hypothetical protein